MQSNLKSKMKKQLKYMQDDYVDFKDKANAANEEIKELNKKEENLQQKQKQINANPQRQELAAIEKDITR